MAIDILNLGQDKQGQSINIFLDGGGKELAEVYKDDDYIVTMDDLEL